MNNYELHMKTHTCHDECQNPVCIAVRKAIAEEREACAKVCEAFSVDRGMIEDEILKKGVLAGASMCAFAIRERGAP